jgi:hypothetical protein
MVFNLYMWSNDKKTLFDFPSSLANEFFPRRTVAEIVELLTAYVGTVDESEEFWTSCFRDVTPTILDRDYASYEQLCADARFQTFSYSDKTRAHKDWVKHSLFIASYGVYETEWDRFWDKQEKVCLSNEGWLILTISLCCADASWESASGDTGMAMFLLNCMHKPVSTALKSAIVEMASSFVRSVHVRGMATSLTWLTLLSGTLDFKVDYPVLLSERVLLTEGEEKLTLIEYAPTWVRAANDHEAFWHGTVELPCVGGDILAKVVGDQKDLDAARAKVLTILLELARIVEQGGVSVT